jgi:CYTH domain-containing protein
MANEIERKFIAKKGKYFKSFVKNAHVDDIEQFYIKITDDEEERYRKKNDKYKHTIKSGSGLSREEDESDVNLNDYLSNLPKKVGKIIKKKRYVVPTDSNHVDNDLEIDVYKSPRFGWKKVIIEIEFEDETEAMTFHFDSWLKENVFNELREVTHNPLFKNKSIALHGFPDVLKRSLNTSQIK